MQTEFFAKYWPDVPRFRDVRECLANGPTPTGRDWKDGTAKSCQNKPGTRCWEGPFTTLTAICGGFPCQPHSLPEKGGFCGRPRLRDLSESFASWARWILAENVPGLLSSEDGRFFGGGLWDLAESGYA